MARNSDSSRKGGEVERCSFCNKSRRQVESLIAGPPDIFICNECITLCNSILVAEKSTDDKGIEGLSAEDLPTPLELKAALDEHVIGQDHAKRVLCVAVHNHYS
ncbi:MAG: ClpX C4-type zinc finger protein, partial [Planctomycetota bacterium]